MADNRKINAKVGLDASDYQAGVEQVKAANAALSTSVAQTGEKASKSLKSIGETATPAAEQLGRAERSMVQSIERATAAFSAGSKSSSDYYRVLATQRGIDPKILEPYLAALDQVAPKQRAVTQAVQSTVPVMKQYEMSAKATAAALRQVPAQLTDIVVSLQGGQAPLTVLLQQGGQLKDIFGGIGPAARALGGYVLALINPFTLLAAAAAAVTYGYAAGSKEADEFRKTLVLTGGAAGVTVGQLSALAATLDDMGTTQGAAAEALNIFAQAGITGASSLERYTIAAIRLEEVGGGAVAETAKAFAELGKDPLKASIKLNEATNFLTKSVFDQIKALDDQGKSVEAARVAQDAYATTVERAASDIVGNLGYIESRWLSIVRLSKEAIDALKSVGRDDPLESQSKKLQGQIDQYKKLGYDTSREEAQLTAITKRILLQQDSAQLDTQRSTQLKAAIKWSEDGNKYLTDKVKLEREIVKIRNEGFSAGASAEDINTRIDKARADFAKKNKDPGASRAGELEKAQAAFDILKIEKAYQAQARALSGGEKILESLRTAGLLDESDYYASKRAFIEVNTKFELAAIDAQLAREKQRKAVGTNATEKAISQLDIDKKVFELEQERGKVQSEAGLAAQLLANQEEAAAAKIVKAYEAARNAAEDYLTTTQAGYVRSLAAQGQGNARRTEQAGRDQINDKYQGDRNSATRKFLGGPDNADTRKELDQQLKLIAEFQQEALKGWEDYYTRLKDGEKVWSNGASRAVEDYLDDAANVSKQAEQLFANAFKGMEDALVTFVTTGQLSFSKLADSIVADVTRIIIKQQIANALTSAIGATGGAGGGVGSFVSALLGGAPGKAVGGPVDAGGLYQVNERGPELLNVAGKQYLMMGGQGGSITPNGGPGGGGNTVIVNVNQSFAAGTTRATTLQAAADASRQLSYAGRNL